MTVKLRDPDAFFVKMDIDFATEHSPHEAILAGKMLRLEEKLTGKTDKHSDKWIRLTAEEWHEELPFFDPKTIWNLIQKLEKKNVLLSCTFIGRSKYYRLNPAFVATRNICEIDTETTRNICESDSQILRTSNSPSPIIQKPIYIDFENLAKKALIFYSETSGVKLSRTEAEPIIKLVQEDGFDLAKWELSCKTCVQSGVRRNNVSCRIDTYHAGGNYKKLIEASRNGGNGNIPKNNPLNAEQLEAAALIRQTDEQAKQTTQAAMENLAKQWRP